MFVTKCSKTYYLTLNKGDSSQDGKVPDICVIHNAVFFHKQGHTCVPCPTAKENSCIRTPVS